MSDLEILKELLSNHVMSSITKKQKESYKLCLCAIFHNIVSGRHLTKGQDYNISLAKEILKMDRKHSDFDGLVIQIKSIVLKTWENSNYVEPFDDELINRIISFFRERINDIEKKDVSLFQAKELERIFNIKKHFGQASISAHHWIEFSLERHLIVTVPEMIIFNDLKVIWNYYLSVREEYDKLKQNVETKMDALELIKKYRDRDYIITTLHRTLVVNCVSFVESYLYNLFYCIKENKLYFDNEKIKSLLLVNKIEDETIVRKILFEIFPQLKVKINKHFIEYKKVSNLRNRYIHASAFIDLSQNISELEPLINLYGSNLLNDLQIAIDMVRLIDEELPHDLKLLWWWYDGNIDFSELKRLDLTNKNANIESITYQQ